jgi:formamidopyrimidine-DNA glycosylase
MRAVLTVPELPEVETLRRGLAARITGMPITAVSILDRKISGGLGDAIQQDIDGHQVSRMARRGKVLILFLREPGETRQESGSLLIHPKMTGQLVLTVNGATVFAGGHPTPGRLRPMDATTRAVFRLGPACCLYYNDARRFGWIRPAGPGPCRTDPFLSRLGPDPLDGNFTPAALQHALARHPRAPVKAVLLDQAAIAGIGNIYADEVLHCAAFTRPARRGASAAPRLAACTPSRAFSARPSIAAGPASPTMSTRPAAARATSAGRTCSAGRACPARCAARRSSAPRSRAAPRTSARPASNAE